jgi:hypothetical protein
MKNICAKKKIGCAIFCAMKKTVAQFLRNEKKQLRNFAP